MFELLSKVTSLWDHHAPEAAKAPAPAPPAANDHVVAKQPEKKEKEQTLLWDGALARVKSAHDLRGLAALEGLA